MKQKKRLLTCMVTIGLVFCLAGCQEDKEELPVLAQPEELVVPSGEEDSLQETEEAPAKSGLAEDEGQTEDSAISNPEAATKEELSKDIYITITAAGDCSLGNYHGQDYSYSFRQTYEQENNPGYFLENVKELFSDDDMTIVNLEGVLTESTAIMPGRTYNISGPPEYVKILTEGSVEAVSMANNHRLDYGDNGTLDTVAALEQEQIVYAYDNNVGMLELQDKEIKIGFVSVNAVNNGAAVEQQVQEGLEKLKEDGADLLLVCCHWGIESDNFPNGVQQNLGHKCIDWGADLVIGHHPHVLQGIEEYNGKFILYSLGNFSFGANRNPKDKDTMIYRQTFHFVDGVKQEDGEARVIPCKVSSINDRNNYQPTPAMEEEWTRIIEKVNRFSEPFGVILDEDGYCKRAITEAK